MKIVMIDKEEGQKVGGIVVYNKRFSEYLSHHGHSIHTLRFTQKRITENNIYPIPFYMAESRSFIFLPSEKTIEIIRNYLLKIKPDIVYMMLGMSPLDIFIPSLCHDLGIPVAGIMHADFNSTRGSYQLLTKSFFLTYSPICRQLDFLHVFTEKMKDFYVRHGVKKNRISVIPNGVNPDIYAPGNSKFARKKHISKGILYLARITLQKNPEALIQSFLSLPPDTGYKLLMVGPGDQLDTLRQRYRNRRVLFIGPVIDEREKIDIIRSCGIYVLPSRFEGMPLALLEAMSCGLACIASDAGSNRELLKDAGFIIPVGRMKQELPTILRLLTTYPELTAVLGRKARQKIISDYSQEILFGKLTDQLRTVNEEFHKNPVKKSDSITVSLNHTFRTLLRNAKQFALFEPEH